MLRRFLLVAVTTTLLSAVIATMLPSVALAAPANRSTGSLAAAQDTVSKRVTVKGFAYDPARPTSSIMVRVYFEGHYAGRVRADRPSPVANRQRHIRGRHRYTLALRASRMVRSVSVVSVGARSGARPVRLAVDRPRHTTSNPGARIVAIAKRFVGHARYVEGGETPRQGFDCSGYTKYAYGRAGVKTLVHNAEAQRRSMHRISARVARPGDLVFDLSGGSAYHVAIYAGHHMQYAAATARDGIRYQEIWSGSVVYGTDWH